jgi:Tol biopolymer transport system component
MTLQPMDHAARLLALLLAASPTTQAEPELFEPGVISTGEFETHPCFTPDGKTLYFLRSKPNFTGWTIYESHRGNDGRWSEPRVAPFSGKHADADPFITADGSRMYFISSRPIDGAERGDMNIWMMRRDPSGAWGQPEPLPAPVNSDGNEWFPTLAVDGTIYFGSDRPGGHGRTDLYRCRLVDGKYQPAENLGDAVNSPADEFEPLIWPDQSRLIFMASGRDDGVGNGDLYISINQDGRWMKATCLPEPVNSRAMEVGAHLAPGGEHLYYGSARRGREARPSARPANDDERIRLGPGNGLGDIYRLPLDMLPRAP